MREDDNEVIIYKLQGYGVDLNYIPAREEGNGAAKRKVSKFVPVFGHLRF